MSLRAKVLIGIAAIIVGILLLFAGIQLSIVFRAFESVEDDYAERNVARVHNVFDDIISGINLKAVDWANWTDTYEFIKNRNEAYIASNLTVKSILDLEINAMLFFDPSGKPIYGRGVNRLELKEVPIPKPLLEALTSRDGELLQFREPDESRSGLLQGKDGSIYLFSARPVATSYGEGPVNGTVVFVRNLDKDILDKVNELTHLRVEMFKSSEIHDLGLIDAQEYEKVIQGGVVLKRVSRSQMEAYAGKKDSWENPAVIYRVSMGRKVFLTALGSSAGFLITVVLMGLSTLALVYFIVERAVLARLLALTHKVNAIAKNRLLEERVPVQGNDELSALSQSINSMLMEIEKHQSEQDRLQEQVRHSQKIEMIGRLAGGIAHDFNNILTVITGYNELMRESDQLPEALKGHLEEIRTYVDKASVLVRQLLTLSRRQVTNPRTVDLNAFAGDTQGMIRSFLESNIELELLRSSEPAFVHVDTAQIEQVMLNLVMNARDAMPYGGKLSIRVEYPYPVSKSLVLGYTTIPAGNYAVLSIRDTGAGMSEEVKSRLFEPYFSTKPKGKGSGLGLLTSHGIVQANKGYMDIHSLEGHGSEIRLYFPAAQPGNVAAEPAVEDKTSAPQMLLGSETIMIVDDEPGIRELIGRVLRKCGYKVYEASNGREAMDIIQGLGDHPLDLLLTDVIMPEMNGAELAREYLAKYPGCKILFMSGYTDNVLQTIEMQDLRAGFEMIQKPFTPLILIEKIRRILDAKTDGSQ